MTLNTNSKKRSGFTLVEVIVVAVIVLVLSAVAIPMYNAYVRQARRDTANNLAETTAAAANAMWRRMGAAAETAPPAGFVISGNGHTPGAVPLRLSFDPLKHRVTIDNGGVVTVVELRNGAVNTDACGATGCTARYKPAP